MRCSFCDVSFFLSFRFFFLSFRFDVLFRFVFVICVVFFPCFVSVRFVICVISFQFLFRVRFVFCLVSFVLCVAFVVRFGYLSCMPILLLLWCFCASIWFASVSFYSCSLVAFEVVSFRSLSLCTCLPPPIMLHISVRFSLFKRQSLSL